MCNIQEHCLMGHIREKANKDKRKVVIDWYIDKDISLDTCKQVKRYKKSHSYRRYRNIDSEKSIKRTEIKMNGSNYRCIYKNTRMAPNIRFMKLTPTIMLSSLTLSLEQFLDLGG